MGKMLEMAQAMTDEEFAQVIRQSVADLVELFPSIKKILYPFVAINTYVHHMGSLDDTGKAELEADAEVNAEIDAYMERLLIYVLRSYIQAGRKAEEAQEEARAKLYVVLFGDPLKEGASLSELWGVDPEKAADV